MSKHFKDKEFACKCGQCKQPQVNPHLRAVLELIRTKFQSPVSITSAYRCPEHNAKEGGSPKSKHMANMAADVQVKDVTPIEVYTFLDETFPAIYGIGKYATFVHIDVRVDRARW